MHLDEVRQLITAHPDFPKPGILFQDIFPIFQHPDAVQTLLDGLLAKIRELDAPVEAVIGTFPPFPVRMLRHAIIDHDLIRPSLPIHTHSDHPLSSHHHPPIIPYTKVSMHGGSCLVRGSRSY